MRATYNIERKHCGSADPHPSPHTYLRVNTCMSCHPEINHCTQSLNRINTSIVICTNTYIVGVYLSM